MWEPPAFETECQRKKSPRGEEWAEFECNRACLDLLHIPSPTLERSCVGLYTLSPTMLHVEVETPPPPSSGSTNFSASSVAALAALSRNASVISSSSSSSSSSSLLLTAARPGPLRTFSSPRNRSPSGGSSTPTRTKAPLYLSKELLAEKTNDISARKLFSKSRSNSNAGRIGPNDFKFGEVLGEGSYSTVCIMQRRGIEIKLLTDPIGHGRHLSANSESICD